MNRNLKSIAAVALLHANVHVQQVLTQTPARQPANPIMGWMAVQGAEEWGLRSGQIPRLQECHDTPEKY